MLKCAYEVGAAGPATCAIYNAANEAAVNLFLNHKCHFLDIYKIVSDMLNQLSYTSISTIDDVIQLDKDVKQRVYNANKVY